ncbi:MAG: glutamate racemase [Erysipelotrichia bacterium]|nr:glutamate racemase [Erysipelotrichia bacterium]
MKDNYIGVIDSGMGGLTVVNILRKKYPQENILFFGDTANVPYGDKSPEEIKHLSGRIINFLNKYPLQAIIIACNTIDSNAGKYLKEISNIPIYNIIKPTCIKACQLTKNKRIGIMATTAAVKSNAYKKELLNLDNSLHIFQKDCPKLVPLIESGHFDKDDPLIYEAVKNYLDDLLTKNIDTLILGCTHYPLLTAIFEELAANINIVSSSNEAVQYYSKNNKDNHNKQGEELYWVSANSDMFQDNAQKFLQKPIKVKEITIE